MNRDTYLKMTRPFRENAKLARSLHIINKIITYAIFFHYAALLVFYVYKMDIRLERAIIVPLDCFIIVTAFRYMIGRKRPYEKFDVPPIIPQDTKGKSFPSRHVFSIFIIGMTYFQLDSNTGIMIFIMGLILAALRVFGGVHYIRDVVAGAITGIVFGAIGFYIIHWETIFGGL